MHTQGDWGVATIDCGAADDEIVAEVNGCLVNIAAVFGSGEYSVATADGLNEPEYCVSEEEAAANARLIAASPRMFAAIGRFLDEQNKRDNIGPLDEAVEELRKAYEAAKE